MAQTVDYFKTLVPIANPSGKEDTIRQFIMDSLAGFGFSDTHVDDAGNLLVRIPGDASKEVLLFSAHMDSVPPCEGIEPVEDTLDGRRVIRSTGKTILGADDKSGIATMLRLAERLHASGSTSHHPLEFLFSTREEVGLLGAKAFDMNLSKAAMGFVLDGEGTIGDIFTSGPTQYNLLFEFQGQSAHAGISPQDGASAILMASQVCAQLPVGRLSPKTTMNIGTIEGGNAINIVPPTAVMRGETRGHEENVLQDLLTRIEGICRQVEQNTPKGKITFTPAHRYSRFEIPADHPVIQKSVQACEALGITPRVTHMNIGSDAHVLNHAGLMTVILGMGFHYSHSLGEHIFVDELEQVSELVWQLIQA